MALLHNKWFTVDVDSFLPPIYFYGVGNYDLIEMGLNLIEMSLSLKDLTMPKSSAFSIRGL